MNRELKKCEGLKSNFLSEKATEARFKQSVFKETMTEVHLMFLQYVLPTFTNFNKFLQREDPLIYCLHCEMENFMSKLACKFIKPESIVAMKVENLQFTSVTSTLQNQKNDDHLSIGFTTKQKCYLLVAEGNIDNYHFDSVRQSYEIAFAYCLKWLPLNNALLKHCCFINFNDRLKFTFDDVQEIISLFPTIYKDLIQNHLSLI